MSKSLVGVEVWWVFKPILVFSFVQAEQQDFIKCQTRIKQDFKIESVSIKVQARSFITKLFNQDQDF